MRGVIAASLLFVSFGCSLGVIAEQPVKLSDVVTDGKPFGTRIANSPFVELYVLEELKQLRREMASQRAELIQQMVDRELSSVDRGVTYATDTITYFFYLIAAASSILVLVGWTSIRDIKEGVHSNADQQVTDLVTAYEKRLRSIENQLTLKTEEIEENREQIALTQEVHSLWLKAGQETNVQSKISVYDQILALQPKDTEALSYKADAVLELQEAQWAVNLCNQALALDPEHSHSLYQLACAYSALGQPDEAVRYLEQALRLTDVYRDSLLQDPALTPLHDHVVFQRLVNAETSRHSSAG